MLRSVFVLTLLASVAAPLPAQEAARDEEMLFVQKLRERGYADLALDYLKTRLSTHPSAALEIALTSADRARFEPDTAKRVGLFGQARTDLDEFIKKNPAHPRLGDARLAMARLSADQGKTQLARAQSLPEGDDGRPAEFSKAAQLLEEAATVIEGIAGTLATDKEKNQAEYERGQLLVARGTAYLALSKVEKDNKQATKLEKQAADVFKQAITVLDGLAEKAEAGDPLKPRARAWAGRALFLNAEDNAKVGRKLNEALNEAQIARDALADRLVRYFDMLRIFENEQGLKPDERAALRSKAQGWFETYSSYRNTPEGAGVQYILAHLLFDQGKAATGQARDFAWNQARSLIRNLESTDNEFSTRAQKLKIDIMIFQKAFERDVKTLTTFDDLYMRALYEDQQLQKEEKKFDTADKKKAQQQLIIDALTRALGAADAARKRGIQTPEVDLANAVTLLSWHLLNVDNLARVVEVGEKFIKEHPRARNANIIAQYTVRALMDLIKKKAGDDYGEMVEERERLFQLASFMAQRWPGDRAGETGKSLVALHLVKKPMTARKPQKELPKVSDEIKNHLVRIERLISDDRPRAEFEKGYKEISKHLKPDEQKMWDDRLAEVQAIAKERREELRKREQEAIRLAGDSARLQLGVERARQGKFIDSILLLRDVKPDFPSYILAQYQLGLAATQLDKDDAERAKQGRKSVLEEENEQREQKLDLGKEKAPFKAMAREAFEKIPDNADLSDPETAMYWFRAKSQLGFMLYGQREYDKMDQISKSALGRLASLNLPEAEKSVFQMQFNSIRLYGLYGKADDLYRAGKFAETVAILDPLVNELKEGKYPEIKDNQPLLSSIMGMALRGNMQSDRVTRAKEVFTVWNGIEKERIKAKTQGDLEKLDAGVKELEGKADKTDEDRKTLETQKMQAETLRNQLTDKGLDEALAEHRANVLLQTFAVIKKPLDELRKKNEKEKLDKMISGFSSLLDAEKGSAKDLKPDLRILLAQCYVPLGKYDQAIDMLKGFPEPNPAEDGALNKYKVAQVLLIRSYRLKGSEEKDTKVRDEARKQAQALLDKIMAPTKEDMMKKPPQPGWGKRDVNAMKEEILLFMDLEAHGAAVNRCNSLLATLGKQLGAGAAIREHYFDVAYYYVVSFTRAALDKKATPAKREEFLTRTARFYTSLLSNHPTLGGAESKERFDSFLKTEEGLELQKYLDKMK